MKGPGGSTAVALIFGVLVASAVVADGPDLLVLVGKWQGRVEGLRGSETRRFLVIERVEGNIAYAQYGTPDKDIFPVQVTIQPDPDGGGRHFVEFYTPSVAGGNHVTVRLTSDGKALRGTFVMQGGGRSRDVNLLRVTE